MNFGTRVEINFHQQSQVSVFLEVPGQESLDALSESALLAALAIRVLSNMGKSQYSDVLAHMLCTTNETIPGMLSGRIPAGVEIIAYPGCAGRIVFTAHAQWMNGRFQTTVKSTGFDWVNTGYGQYGPMSVIAFIQYLVAKHAPPSLEQLNLSRPLNAICGTTMMVGEYYRQGRVSVFANHDQLAIEAAQASCVMAGIDWSEYEETQPQLLPAPQNTGCLLLTVLWVASAAAAILLCVTLAATT